MKRIINAAFVYAVLGLLAGVFYREFTRIMKYTGESMLSVLHTHLFILGMLFLLVVALFYKQYNLEESKKFKMFFLMYNISLPFFITMLIIRGTTQVMQLPLSQAVDFSIAIIAGISHIFMAGAIIHFFLAVKEKV